MIFTSLQVQNNMVTHGLKKFRNLWDLSIEIAKHNGTHITSIDIKLSTKRSYSMQFAWKSLLGNMLFEGEVNEVWNEV